MIQSIDQQFPLEIEFDDLPSTCECNIIDCRSTQEFESSHLNEAINIPLQHLSIEVDNFPFNKEDTFFIYCNSGNRSRTFATFLRSLGFLKCQSIAGGLELWGDSPTC
ncbi:MAG: rhodanese-like domain-containing protein [Phycisphaerales bacterium]|jgi:rhodanese-related sulfurtransferase|nr:rhodanese-like domain-containing protein [Phycisphaerales bacterium]